MACKVDDVRFTIIEIIVSSINSNIAMAGGGVVVR